MPCFFVFFLDSCFRWISIRSFSSVDHPILQSMPYMSRLVASQVPRLFRNIRLLTRRGVSSLVITIHRFAYLPAYLVLSYMNNLDCLRVFVQECCFRFMYSTFCFHYYSCHLLYYQGTTNTGISLLAQINTIDMFQIMSYNINFFF